MAFLIGARMVQGLGAGGLLAITFTLVGELYSLQERSRIQGFLSGVWGVSGLVGPIVGGLIVDHTSWRWVFYLNVPFGLAAMALVGRTYTDLPRAARPSLPASSAVLFAVGAGLFVYGMQIHGPVLLAAGVVSLVAFGEFERRQSSSLIPLDTLRHPLIGRAFVGSLVAGMAFFGCATFIPLFGQAARGGTATEAGILLAPMSVGWTIGSILSARVLPSRGPRSLSVAGAVEMIVGFGLWAAFVGAPLWALGALLFVTGFGMGMFMLALIVSAQEESPREVLGIVTGLIQFARNFGGAIGAGLMGALLGPSLVLGGHALYDVFWRVPLVAGVLAVGALVTAAGLPAGAVSRESR